jgi:hypothetical protein
VFIFIFIVDLMWCRPHSTIPVMPFGLGIPSRGGWPRTRWRVQSSTSRRVKLTASPHRQVATLVVAIALIASACSGRDDDQQPAARAGDEEPISDLASSTTEPQKPTVPPIVVFSSLSGSFGGFESVPNAFIAGLQAQNERGGIAGHPVQALFCRASAPSCMQEALDKGAVAIAVSLFVEGDYRGVKTAFQSHGLTQIASVFGSDPAEVDLGAADLASTSPGALSSEATAVLFRSLGVRSYVVVPPSSYRAMGTGFPRTSRQPSRGPE